MSLPYALLIAPVDHDADRDGFDDTFVSVAPSTPVLPLDDDGVLRGDAVFETLGVVDGHAQDVEAHLARLDHSSRLCDLPRPNAAQWRAAIARVAAECPAGESAIRLVLSRGRGSGPTAWIVANPALDNGPARTTGIRVVTLDRGLDSGAAARAPWLLLGAKTQSYAVNMAALREAHRRDADDVVFVSSDGVLMEGPTSSVVLRIRGHFRTPRHTTGILRGTTQLALFAHLAAEGVGTAEEDLSVDDLRNADAAWLLSSVRLAAPIRAVDGAPRPVDADLTAALNAALLRPRS
ncbi:aminotransferase class IV [Microbacterium sp. X-17]|uniref:aminotransferase class IV n=1 Tax=Microbacterium sp. X-17 TaxID=3144404 RepID=UPI0031F4F8DA